MWIGQTGNIIASARAKLPTNCRSKISDWIRAIFFISSMLQFKISWQAIGFESRFANRSHISIDYILVLGTFSNFAAERVQVTVYD